MISQILEVIETDLLALPFIERYGGVIRVITRTGFNQETGESFEESFPVSCNTDGADCFQNGQYLALTPDDSKKSVAYFEESGLNFDGYTSQRRDMFVFSGSVRFVLWLNTKLLGYNTCDMQPYVLGSLLDLFQVINKPFDASVLKFASINMAVESIEPKTPGPFIEYAYEDRQFLLMHPYDFISLDINLQAKVSKSCLDSFTLPQSIPC